MTQHDQIIEHIKQYGSITSLEAALEYGILQMGARICELRKSGIPIEGEYETHKNRAGEIKKFIRYTLPEGYNFDEIEPLKKINRPADSSRGRSSL